MCAHEVVCWETGKVYPSVKAAAESAGTSRTSVMRAIAGGRMIDRRHFYYASMPRPEPEELFWPDAPLVDAVSGEVWACAHDAARDLKVRYETVLEAVRTCTECKGLELEYVFCAARDEDPVRCVETGTVYDSAYEAAYLCHIPHAGLVSRSCDSGRPCYGFRFERAAAGPALCA